jgi:hypothetical protein
MPTRENEIYKSHKAENEQLTPMSGCEPLGKDDQTEE